MRANDFYPIFSRFWLFWRILCTLTHFGESMVIVGAPTRGRQMGNREYPDPKGPQVHICPPSCQLSKYGPTGAHLSPLGVMVTATTRLQVPLKMTMFLPKFTKVHTIRRKSPKRPKYRVNFVCTHFPDPPPSPNRPEGWFFGPRF